MINSKWLIVITSYAVNCSARRIEGWHRNTTASSTMASVNRGVVQAWAQCGCGCRPHSKHRRVWYDKLYAKLISRSTVRYNQLLDARKKSLLGVLVEEPNIQDVLEIGVGSGANLPYFAAARKDVRYTGVDPNAEMLPYLTAACDEAGFPSSNLTFAQGVAEALPLPDESQDVVISTLVLCSVADQRAALAEVLRVLRPGGSFLFMEHVAAPLGSWPRSIQELISPAWQVLFDGCHINRETWSSIRSAGFSSCDLTHFNAINNPLFTVISPHIMGRAVK